MPSCAAVASADEAPPEPGRRIGLPRSLRFDPDVFLDASEPLQHEAPPAAPSRSQAWVPPEGFWLEASTLGTLREREALLPPCLVIPLHVCLAPSRASGALEATAAHADTEGLASAPLPEQGPERAPWPPRPGGEVQPQASPLT